MGFFTNNSGQLTSAGGSVIGGAIGGVSSLAGGLMSMFNAKADRDFQNKMWQKNYDAQKEFSQNSIQWRVDDAKKAGIHPLAALGNMGASYTPSAAMSSDDNMGQHIAQAGAQLGMAISEATLRKEEAEARGKELDNLNKELSLASRRMGQTDDLLASVSKGLSGLVEAQKSQHQIFQDRYAGSTSLYQNRQGLSKDMLDPASEALFGLGVVPDVFSSVIDSYSDKSAAMLQLATDAGLDKYLELNTSRPALNAWRPVYNFTPSDSYYKAPKHIQKKVDDFIRAFNK